MVLMTATLSYIKVRAGLEWLKLNRPPLSIRAFSEFMRHLQIDDTLSSERSLALVERDGIGSLSGLIAGSLASLQPKDAGLFRVSYVTSTSQVGGVFLRKYLHYGIEDCGAQPVDIINVGSKGRLAEVVSVGQKYRVERSPMPWRYKTAVNSSELDSSTVVSTKQYLEYLVPELDAVAVVSPFPSLLEVLPEIILNTSSTCTLLVYLGIEYAESFTRRYWEDLLKAVQNSHNLILCLSSEVSNRFYDSAKENPSLSGLINHAVELSSRTDASILVHDDFSVVFAQYEQSQTIQFPDPLDQAQLARFLAAYLLSRTVDSLVQQLSDVGTSYIHQSESLALANLWTQSASSTCDFPTEIDLIAKLDLGGEFASELLIDEELEQGTTFSIGAASLEYWRRLIKVILVARTENRQGKLYQYVQQKDDVTTSIAIDELKRLGALSDAPTLAEERVIFVDLDRTLFDYTSARSEATHRAFEKLSLEIPVPEAIEIYEKIVRHSAGFEALGFPNMSRTWNSETMYNLIHLLTSERFHKELNEFFGFVQAIESAVDDGHTVQNIVDDFEIAPLFLECLRILQSDLQVQHQVHRAYLEFEAATARLAPFADARDFLSTLMQMNGYHVFVVTEGDQYIQWQKIEKLGLGDLITPDRFIVTDRLAEPVRLLQTFENLEKELRANAASEHVAHLQLQAVRFVRDLFNRLRYKKDRYFFGHAIHIAVQSLLHREETAGFANVSESEWQQLKPIKLATIGDRYLNDILPLMELVGEQSLLSVRMLYGKYMNEQPGSKDPQPDLVVKRLTAGRNFFLRDINWNSKKPLIRPKHFGSVLNNEEMVYALIALTMDPIRPIAEALLEDVGFSSTEVRSLRHRVDAEVSQRKKSRALKKRLSALI